MPMFAFIAVSAVMLYLIVRGAPYVPTVPKRALTMVHIAGIHPGERAVDLGSGDGRIVIELAKAGAEVCGYEINPWLVYVSRRAIARAGLSGRAKIFWGDFWKQDLSPFSAVTIYGVPYIMGRLERKLSRELAPGSRVVSNNFKFPHWKASATAGHVRMYIKVA